MSNNSNLHRAKKAKNDEFYTQFSDIENELKHYKEHFKDKVVYCNCDDPRQSNFVKYFQINFDALGLKKLIATGYKKNGHGVKLVYDSDHKDANVQELQDNGDFRSQECVKLLDEADIVVTNPPFSLFREYVAQLVGHGKKFLIIGNINAVNYICPYIKNKQIWLGFGTDSWYRVPDDFDDRSGVKIEDGKKYFKVKSRWFTNLDVKKRHEFLTLTEKYDKAKYPKFDNYDAINVDKVNDIPKDYWGVMGVPTTFLTKFCPEQFNIIGITYSKDKNPDIEKIRTSPNHRHNPIINGKDIYPRILVQRRKPVGENGENENV